MNTRIWAAFCHIWLSVSLCNEWPASWGWSARFSSKPWWKAVKINHTAKLICFPVSSHPLCFTCSPKERVNLHWPFQGMLSQLLFRLPALDEAVSGSTGQTVLLTITCGDCSQPPASKPTEVNCSPLSPVLPLHFYSTVRCKDVYLPLGLYICEWMALSGCNLWNV